jgi:hypothetical protein
MVLILTMPFDKATGEMIDEGRYSSDPTDEQCGRVVAIKFPRPPKGAREDCRGYGGGVLKDWISAFTANYFLAILHSACIIAEKYSGIQEALDGELKRVLRPLQ